MEIIDLNVSDEGVNDMLYLTLISCSSYILAAGCQAQRLRHPTRNTLLYLFRLTSFLSICAHGYLLYLLIETPQGQNLYGLLLLSLICWLLNLTIFLSIHLVKIENLALFAYPLTTLFLIFAYAYPGQDVVQTNALKGMVSHIWLSLVTTSTLCLAFLQAILLGVQNKQLKHRLHAPILRLLPPLQTMESLLFIFLWFGMLLLTLTLVSGLHIQYHYPARSHTPEILLSFISWIIIFILLIGRYRLGWQLQKAVIGSCLGFLFVFLSYFSTHI